MKTLFIALLLISSTANAKTQLDCELYADVMRGAAEWRNAGQPPEGPLNVELNGRYKGVTESDPVLKDLKFMINSVYFDDQLKSMSPPAIYSAVYNKCIGELRGQK